jgi:DNA-binding CsgD family transcriptional regulator
MSRKLKIISGQDVKGDMRVDQDSQSVDEEAIASASISALLAMSSTGYSPDGLGAIQTAFEALNISAVLLLSDGSVCGQTRSTQARWCDKMIRVRDGGVVAMDRHNNHQLQEIIADMAADPSVRIRWAYWVNRATGEKFTVKCFRVAEKASLKMAMPAMILTIRPLVAITRNDSMKLSNILGLTPAEGEILVMLSAGETRKNIAAARGTTTHTVASQLKTIFQKCGVRREAELVALVASLSGIWAFSAF